MKKSRHSPLLSPPAPTAVVPSPGPIAAWSRFWFTPADPVGLHVLRLLAGLLFLAWLLPLAGQRDAFFGLNGWFDRQAYAEAARLPGGPPAPFSWSILYWCGTDTTCLTAVYWGAIAVVALFIAGVLPRLMAVLSWVVVASFTVNPVFAALADADALLLLLAFYLMLGYLLYGLRDGRTGLALRLVGPLAVWPIGGRRLCAPAFERPSLGANLALRLMQVHFAIAMVAGGLHKLQSGDWWFGAALWYPLHSAFATTAEQIREEAPQATTILTLLSLAAYASLAWQIAFPVFAWRPRWRALVLGGAVTSWLGCGFIFHLPIFGPAVLVSCLGYLSASEWRSLLTLLARAPGLRRIGSLADRSGGPARNEMATPLGAGRQA